ncbi:MAG: sensor histidine kinase [bacterium]
MKIGDYLNLIQMDKEDEGILNEDNELYFAINSASRRLIRTIEMIVTMSELQQNIYHIEKKPVLIICDILEPLVDTYKKEAHKKGLLLQIENNAFIQNICIDKDSIMQVLDNVLDNAVKYTKSGSIKIIINNDTEDTLLISIIDTGIGIAEKYLDTIYKPFTQEDEGYTRRFEGNGLGLAISKRFCDLNEVIFNIETKKNIGTTVNLIFKLEI